jgi:hypothetical protein
MCSWCHLLHQGPRKDHCCGPGGATGPPGTSLPAASHSRACVKRRAAGASASFSWLLLRPGGLPGLPGAPPPRRLPPAASGPASRQLVSLPALMCGWQHLWGSVCAQPGAGSHLCAVRAAALAPGAGAACRGSRGAGVPAGIHGVLSGSRSGPPAQASWPDGVGRDAAAWRGRRRRLRAHPRPAPHPTRPPADRSRTQCPVDTVAGRARATRSPAGSGRRGSTTSPPTCAHTRSATMWTSRSTAPCRRWVPGAPLGGAGGGGAQVLTRRCVGRHQPDER